MSLPRWGSISVHLFRAEICTNEMDVRYIVQSRMRAAYPVWEIRSSQRRPNKWDVNHTSFNNCPRMTTCGKHWYCIHDPACETVWQKPSNHRGHMGLQNKSNTTVDDSYSFSRTNHMFGKNPHCCIMPEAKYRGQWLVKLHRVFSIFQYTCTLMQTHTLIHVRECSAVHACILPWRQWLGGYCSHRDDKDHQMMQKSGSNAR